MRQPGRKLSRPAFFLLNPVNTPLLSTAGSRVKYPPDPHDRINDGREQQFFHGQPAGHYADGYGHRPCRDLAGLFFRQ